MKRRIIILSIIMVMIVLLFAGCDKNDQPTEKVKDNQQDYLQESTTVQAEQEIAQDENGISFYELDTMQASAESFVKTVEAKGYRTITRDEIWIQNETYPCTWVFAINDQGEFLDYLMMEPDKDALLEQAFDESLNGWRKEECGKFCRELDYPMYLAGPCSTKKLDYQNSFVWRIQGSVFAFEDIGIEPFVPVYWQGEEQELKERPDGYPLSAGYLEAKTMEQDIQALKDRLSQSELNYTWEEKDTIEIGGVSYPVIWLSIRNDACESMDVVWSEDTTLAYQLSRYGDEFLNLHKEDNEAYVREHGGNEDITLMQWIAQDCFYNGYSVFYTGRGFPLLDCGLQAGIFELSPSGQDMVQWYDRNSYCDWQTEKKVILP